MEGVAPSSPVRQTGALLLSYTRVVSSNMGTEGIAPPTFSV